MVVIEFQTWRSGLISVENRREWEVPCHFGGRLALRGNRLPFGAEEPIGGDA